MTLRKQSLLALSNGALANNLGSTSHTPAGRETAFASAIRGALEAFGASGGTVTQARTSLVRYAAQTAVFEGRSEQQFVDAARAAYRIEREVLRTRAKGQG